MFYFNESAGISSLDPAFARDNANIWAVNQLFNGLVQTDSNMNITPCIAHSWEISGDGKVYTFHLRNDVYFHDDDVFPQHKGRKVVAADFIYSFNRLADPLVAASGSWVMGQVAVDEYNKHLAISASDDSTLEIRLKKNHPPFISMLAMQYCCVVPGEAIIKYGKDFRSHPVGTGPFRFSYWKESEQLVLLRNEHYFEKENGIQLPFLDAISISFIRDKQAAFMEFLQGRLDFISGLDASFRDALLTPDGKLMKNFRGKFELQIHPYLNTEYLGFLMESSPGEKELQPLQQKKIRQALNMGFDRQLMITYLRNGIGISGLHGFVPYGISSFNPEKVEGYHYDPIAVKRLLTEAGFPDGVGLPEISLSTTGSYLDLCQFMQKQLSVFGIKIKLDVNQPGQHRELVSKQKLKFFRGSWVADYADPENYLAVFYSKNFAPSGPNYTHYNNPHFDSLYEHAMSERIDSIRMNLYSEMDQTVMEDAPVIVLYYDQIVRLIQRGITDVGINSSNLLTLKRCRK